MRLLNQSLGRFVVFFDGGAVGLSAERSKDFSKNFSGSPVLRAGGRFREDWIEALGSFTGARRKLLCQRIAERGPDVVEGLGQLLGHRSEHVRRGAIECLLTMGEDAAPAKAVLKDCLRDDDASVREAAAEALGHLGLCTIEVCQELIQCLRDHDAGVRYTALWTLRERCSVPEALRSMMDRYVTEMADPINALEDSTVGEFFKLMEGREQPDWSPEAKQQVFEATLQLGSPERALANLQAALSEVDKTRTKTKRELGAGPAAVFFLTENFLYQDELLKALNLALLRSPDPLLRASVAFVMVKHNWLARPARAVVSQALLDRCVWVRRLAAKALGKLGVNAAPALAMLVQALSDKDAEVVCAAAWSLAYMGKKARPATPMLKKLQSDARPSVRAAANEALVNLGMYGSLLDDELAQ